MFYDITRELFSAPTYPGDTRPSYRRVSEIARGDECTLTDVALCAHNATHMDAPAHFVAGGKTAEALALSRCCGTCAVRTFAGELRAEDLRGIRAKRLLMKGKYTVTPEAARRMREKFLLVGTQKLSVGGGEVHRILLGGEVAVLEGLDLSAVPDGRYRLYAFPVKWGGCDGAPVRAVLQDIRTGGGKA